MAEIVVNERQEQGNSTVLRVLALEDKIALSKGKFTFTETTYGKGKVKTMLAGGIATPVENRRGGNVRKMFSYMHSYAAEEGVPVALLHPFSFSYYRMFGYEKVADHLIVRFPSRLIDFVPRRCSFRPFDDSMLNDVVSVYEKFSHGRNLLLAKNKIAVYNKEKQSVYVCYDGKEPTAYIVYSTDQKFAVNHYIDGVLTVHELAYTSPAALLEIFSFLRMFEGEFEEIEFANASPCPEIDLILKHYTHTSYKLLPDLMAKVLDTEKMLSMQEYPVREGEFTIKVIDDMPSVSGVYKVCYGGADRRVTRVIDSHSADVTLNSCALARLIYGYDGIHASFARYMDGIEIYQDCEDFFRAFPKRACGMFEHF